MRPARAPRAGERQRALFFVAIDRTVGRELWMIPRADYDLDGDGKADLGVFRQSTGEWLVFGSATGFPGPILFGAPRLGDIPLNLPAALR